MDTDVLIVGAGPTGLMLACQLVRRGVRCTIIDRHPGPARETRALGVQARTLEIYAKLGIVDRALELGKHGTGANMWSEGRWMARIPLGDAGRDVSPYPFVLILGQDDNERIMGERLSSLGLAVQWNTELVGLEQDADGATARLKHTDGTTSVLTAAWVAGCDGAHSTVRERCGIAFVGAPYEHVFYVADTQVTGGMVPDEVNVYLWRAGFHLFFPMRGVDHWRIVGIVPSEIRDREDVTFESVLPSILGEVGLDLAFEQCSWFSTYRIAHRRAERFRDGRCFLLGDAAHVHSPVGAQGMNTGLQDAYNLAWKLALVTAGRANAALLDSYEAERVPVAEQLLHTTDRAFKLAIADSALLGLIRTEVVARIGAFAMSFERTQRLAFRVISQTGIHYRASPLSSSPPAFSKDAPQAGDRFPWLKLRLRADGPVEDLLALDDTRFHLLVFGQSSSSAGNAPYADVFDVRDVPLDADNAAALKRAHIPCPSFYLLRPDGHVGLCGTDFDADACGRYVSDRLRM